MSRITSGLKRKYHKRTPGSTLDPCVFCGGEANTIDHIIPRSQDGDDDIENLAPMCRQCNSNKADGSILMAYYNCHLQRRVKEKYRAERNRWRRAG